jgi:hypothetical protein
MQSLTIFETREDICFVFQNLEKFEIHLEKFKLTGTHLSVAHFEFKRATRLPGPTHLPFGWSPPVTIAARGLVHIPSCMDTVENRLPLSAPSTLCSLSALAFAQFLAVLRPCSPALSPMSRDLPSIMSSVCAVSPSTRASFHEQCTPPTMKRTEARHHFVRH